MKEWKHKKISWNGAEWWELLLCGECVGIAQHSAKDGCVVFESIAGDCGPDVRALGGLAFEPFRESFEQAYLDYAERKAALFAEQAAVLKGVS